MNKITSSEMTDTDYRKSWAYCN